MRRDSRPGGPRAVRPCVAIVAGAPTAAVVVAVAAPTLAAAGILALAAATLAVATLAAPLAAQEAAATAALPAADRPIPEWLILGTWAVVPGEERLSRPYLPGEADAAPAAGDAVEGRTWTRAAAEPANFGRLDLLPVLEGVSPVADAAAYAFAWIASPEDRTVALAFESDDDLRVWLNGTLVIDHEVARGVGSGTDTATVRLSAGANRLLLKVVNRSGGFGLGGRVLAESADPIGDLGLTVTRPSGVALAGRPAPAVTLAAPAIPGGAVLDAAAGALRMPVSVRAGRWGGLEGDVVVGVGDRTVALPPGGEGETVQAELETTWEDLARAAAADERVVARAADGRTWERAFDAGPVLASLARPIEVAGWGWRDETGAWLPLPEAGPYGVDPGIRRRASAIGFGGRVPRALGGLSLEMDAAEMPEGAAFVVNGDSRTRGPGGRVRLCGPCGAGDSLVVRVEPGGERWWDAPRLVVPDAGWHEIDEGARWAAFFLGGADGTGRVPPPPRPGPDVATDLLAGSLDPDKTRYREIVGAWLERLAPAAAAIRADTVDLVGNSHIDAAWLWRWPETVDVVRNTWRSATKLMAKYPEATYAASSAAYYEWLEEYEPDLLDEIRRLVDAGRWEPVGGWWVEPDANMPSGESAVRQALYGQATYERLFGRPARVMWIPDTFGYAWTLPQIFRKSGLEAFVTQKVRWNDTDAWTADRNLFWWEGRDGTRILTYVPYGYSHHLEPDRLGQQWIASRDSTAGGGMLVLYGVGDHGGGPTMEMMDRRRSLERVPTYPPLEGTLPSPAIERMRTEGGDDAPVIDDELYLEYHRGVLTSQGRTKAWNRRLENLLATAEAAAAHASTLDPGEAWYNYPGGALSEAWKITLFNQFHDILPGSGIGPVYADAARDYERAAFLAETSIERAGERIASGLDTRSPVEGARPWIVLNPSGRARTGEVAVPWEAAAARVVDGTGAELPSVVRDGRLAFQVEDVPPTGGRVVFLLGDAAGDGAGGGAVRGSVGAPDGGDGGSGGPGRPGRASAATPGAPVVLETPALRVEIDRATGELARVLDRVTGREVLLPGGGGNRLATMEDRPLQWDAWNIDGVEGPWTPVADTVVVGPVVRDALGVSVTVVRADQHGRYEQVVRVPFAGEGDGSGGDGGGGDGRIDRGGGVGVATTGRRVDIETTAQWRADHRLLKASFPVTVGADSVWAEIPYGAIGRPAVPATVKDSARYETPMLRWIDASDGGWGVSIVNDGKYGYDVQGDTLRITLLKAATWPDSVADRGTHRFRYSLVVHDGDWTSGATERVADELNRPLRAVPVDEHSGEGRAAGFAAVDGAELGALKVAEDGDGLVLRLVDRHGAGGFARVTLPWAFEWQKTDLLERGTGAWVVEEDRVAEVRLEPWEIATVRVRRR